MYYAVRGIRPADILKMPLLEQVMLYEAARREAEIESKKLELLLKAR